MRVLLVEDDAPLARSVRDALAPHGLDVEWLDRAATAEAVLRSTGYDLAILDIGLPDLSGLELLRRLRRAGLGLPVLMLTARDALADRVRGLNEGADDYLVKPFQTPELVARCQALVRRGRQAGGSTLSFGPLQLDQGQREASLAGDALALTGREWDLLLQLILSAPKVVTKQHLVDSLSRWDSELTTNAVEIYVSRLRGKLGERGVVLRTVRGLGYRLDLLGDGA